PIEKTMPTHSSEACVISFDVVNSSKIQHVKTKEFFHKVFSRCYDAMMSGYESDSLKARAYRIKEMGDGFLCSVGYPFGSLNSNICIAAVQIAIEFHHIFCEEVEAFAYHDPIYCSIGIAIGGIGGFYPENGTKEYDLYGTSIILATRYEGMRKSILNEDLKSNIIILQERVAISLRPDQRAKFTPFNLVEKQLVVRDDASARMLYYYLIPGGSAGLRIHQLKEAV
ncbi:MAG TPA: adenylate/guanylate cyclase domain-containing protein, partial [Oligoflexus sp.]|uniref:adenylate/guanylate cyclase domain-containing protein n=1 Tax=Oligoflexus sp. TaxID=1971216 RepID=UPI002D68F6AC